MRPLRLGSVPYVNAAPLTSWLHEPDCPYGFTIRYEPPSRLATLLDEGALDLALVSSVELVRRSDLRYLPGPVIASEGPVLTVRALCRKAPHEVRKLAADTASLTSVALARIWWRETYGYEPVILPMPPDVRSMMEQADAALVIGALEAEAPLGLNVLDLGAAWHTMTGLPFVFAAWIGRDGLDWRPAASLLTEALDRGMAQAEALSVRWARRLGQPAALVHGYFTEIMRYRLTPAAEAGLRLFAAKCREHGIIWEASMPRRFSLSGAGEETSDE
ncbi:MAG: menaquinone biosynthesis protein [Armatimonadetes bacterium]|nr:menaquinone biosynthesis protein [Armatimonadota bacterium]